MFGFGAVNVMWTYVEAQIILHIRPSPHIHGPNALKRIPKIGVTV